MHEWECPRGIRGGDEELVQTPLELGNTFIDVGANESYFSMLALQLVGPLGLVMTVEPQQRLNADIRRNIRIPVRDLAKWLNSQLNLKLI